MRKVGSLLIISGLMLSAPAGSQTEVRPIDFFEGTTVSEGTVKVMMQRPTRTRSVNRGKVGPDGTLVLVQHVEDEGKPRQERHWRIRQTGPRNYVGTMSEARGPVTVEQVGDRYRFRFKVKGNMSVEQWLQPHPDGRTAKSFMTVRKFGLAVASSEATIRKVGA